MPHPPMVLDRAEPAGVRQRLAEPAAEAGNPEPQARVDGEAAVVAADGADAAAEVLAAEASAAAEAVSEEEGRSSPAPAPIRA